MIWHIYELNSSSGDCRWLGRLPVALCPGRPAHRQDGQLGDLQLQDHCHPLILHLLTLQCNGPNKRKTKLRFKNSFKTSDYLLMVWGKRCGVYLTEQKATMQKLFQNDNAKESRICSWQDVQNIKIHLQDKHKSYGLLPAVRRQYYMVCVRAIIAEREKIFGIRSCGNEILQICSRRNLNGCYRNLIEVRASAIIEILTDI